MRGKPYQQVDCRGRGTASAIVGNRIAHEGIRPVRTNLWPDVLGVPQGADASLERSFEGDGLSRNEKPIFNEQEGSDIRHREPIHVINLDAGIGPKLVILKISDA